MIATAKREMIEEIGSCKILSERNLGIVYPNTSFYENPVGIILLIVEISKSNVQREEGIVDFRFFTRNEVEKMIYQGKIEDLFTLSALTKYLISKKFT